MKYEEDSASILILIEDFHLIKQTIGQSNILTTIGNSEIIVNSSLHERLTIDLNNKIAEFKLLIKNKIDKILSTGAMIKLEIMNIKAVLEYIISLDN